MAGFNHADTGARVLPAKHTAAGRKVPHAVVKQRRPKGKRIEHALLLEFFHRDRLRLVYLDRQIIRIKREDILRLILAVHLAVSHEDALIVDFRLDQVVARDAEYRAITARHMPGVFQRRLLQRIVVSNTRHESVLATHANIRDAIRDRFFIGFCDMHAVDDDRKRICTILPVLIFKIDDDHFFRIGRTAEIWIPGIGRRRGFRLGSRLHRIGRHRRWRKFCSRVLRLGGGSIIRFMLKITNGKEDCAQQKYAANDNRDDFEPRAFLEQDCADQRENT